MNNETQALAIPSQESVASMDAIMRQATPEKARVIEVTNALEPAYQRASTLELTEEEIRKLTEPFPDEIIELRPHDGLIYIPHIFISKRLNSVFGPGKWALIRRREWFAKEEQVVYGEYVLLIRGCYVGESIGGHPYVENNPKVNYSDTLESTAAEALRRICGKRLGCGDQVWEPEYCRQWTAKYSQKSQGRWQKGVSSPQERPTASQRPNPPQPPSQTVKTPPSPSPKAAKATQKEEEAFQERCKTKFLARCKEMLIPAWIWAVQKGHILPTEELSAIRYTKVPTTAERFEEVSGEIQEVINQKLHEDGEWVAKFEAAYDQVPGMEPEPPAPTEEPPPFDPEPELEWRKQRVPPYKDDSMTLDQLPTNKRFGYWANFKAAQRVWRGKTYEPTAEDFRFREMLDAMGEELNFKLK